MNRLLPLCSPGKGSPRTNSELVSSSNSLINTLQCIPTGSHPVLPVGPSTVTTVRPSWLHPLCSEQNYNLLTATFQACRAHSWRTVSLWDVNINSDGMSLCKFSSPLLSVVQFRIYLSIMHVILPLQNILYKWMQNKIKVFVTCLLYQSPSINILNESISLAKKQWIWFKEL